MLCPVCDKDFKKDVEKDETPGMVTFINDHDFRPFTEKGTYCPNCGRIIQTLVIPIPHAFKRSQIYDPNLEKLVKEFQQRVKVYYEDKDERNHQYSMKFSESEKSK